MVSRQRRIFLGSLRLIGHAAFEIWDTGVSLFFLEEKNHTLTAMFLLMRTLSTNSPEILQNTKSDLNTKRKSRLTASGNT